MSYSIRKLAKFFAEKGHLCWYCGLPAESLDHFIPRSEGGSSEDDNLIPCCIKCNTRKSARSLEYFRGMEARKTIDMPIFSLKQIDFLKRYGIDLPNPEYKFWFEKQNLKI